MRCDLLVVGRSRVICRPGSNAVLLLPGSQSKLDAINCNTDELELLDKATVKILHRHLLLPQSCTQRHLLLPKATLSGICYCLKLHSAAFVTA
jgi:hypothetical protein